VAYQIRQVLALPPGQVNGQVLYVGDAPFELSDWVHAVSMRLTGRPPKTAPRSVLYSAALLGELLQRIRIKAPLNMLRYKAMTEDYLTPIQRTLDLVGPSPYSLEQGIEETIRWFSTGEVRATAESSPAAWTRTVPPATANFSHSGQ
jgi:hypothetical protein